MSTSGGYHEYMGDIMSTSGVFHHSCIEKSNIPSWAFWKALQIR